MSAIDRTSGSSRAQLLKLLRRSPASISELAAALGISDNAVRMHLTALQRDGLVRHAGVVRATGGKPAQLYDLTAEAEERFPKAYAFALAALVEVLEQRAGREEVVSLLREVGAHGAGTPARGKAAARVEAAAALLRQLGGDVDAQRGEGGWMMRGYGCPLSAVTARHPEVCALVEAIIARVTGLRVRECCDRRERPRCRFQVFTAATV